MTQRTITAFQLVLVILLVWPAMAVAQTGWDAGRYSALVRQGSDIYTEAQRLPPEALNRRRELLFESAALKLEAREMVDNALAAGLIEPLFRAQAVNELFNLNENLIVTLIELDQCEGAALLLGQVTRDEALIPPDGRSHLDLVRPRLDECRARVTQRTEITQASTIAALSREAEQWRESAAGGAQDGFERDPLLESVQKEQELIDLVRTAILSGSGIEGIDDPAALLFAHYPALIDGLVELGFCEMAQRRLAWYRFDADLMEPGSIPEDQQLSDRVQSCTAARPRDVLSETLPRPAATREREPLPYVLLFTAAAAGAAGLVIDLSLEEDRASLAQAERECESGTCDWERVLRLNDSIDRTKWVIRGVGATAVVAGIVGLVWLVVGGGDDEGPAPGAIISPLVFDQGFGASLNWLQ